MSNKTPKNMNMGIVALPMVFLFVGVFIGNSISGYYTYRIETDVAGLDCMSIEEFTEIDISVLNEGIIFLTSGCRRMSMLTTPEQTMSIDRALKGMGEPRPLAHDLMSNQIEVFGIEVVMVKIHTFEDGIYYANLILRQNNIVLEMDSRPSDAIAIAVRTGAPIYVSTTLLEEKGKAVC